MLNIVSVLSHFAQFGLIYPLVSLWLAFNNVPSWEIGLVASLYWCGMLLGSTIAPFGMHTMGVRKVIVLSACITAVAALSMAYLPVNSPTALKAVGHTFLTYLPTWLVWGLMGAVIGLGTGLRWVANESWLYALVPTESSGRIVGWHETLIHLTQTLGPVVIAAVGVGSVWGFYWGAFAAIFSAVAVLFARTPMPENVTAQTLAAHSSAAQTRDSFTASVLKIWRQMWQGWITTDLGLCAKVGLWAGLIDGVLFGMFTIYCVNINMSADVAAWIMVVFGLGGLLSSAPLGILCDRKGLAFAIRCICLLGFITVALLILHRMLTTHSLFSGGNVFAFSNHIVLWIAAAGLGVIAAAGLTLAMIVATQDASRLNRDLAQSIGEVSLAFTLGSIAGPAMAGVALEFFGALGYIFLCAILFALGMRLK